MPNLPAGTITFLSAELGEAAYEDAFRTGGRMTVQEATRFALEQLNGL